jgi:predicted dehydrogenase
VTHASNEPQDTLDVYGTLGSIHIAPLNSGEVRVRIGGVERVESLPPAANIHAPLIEEFMQAVAAGREPAVTGEMGRAVARLEERIYSAG